jgi:membrane-associated phospholipid phosphatase
VVDFKGRQTRKALRDAMDPLRPLNNARAIAIGSAVTVALVVVLGAIVAHASGWDAHELAVLQWLSTNQISWLAAVALGIAWLFSPPIALAITLLSGLGVVVVTRSLSRALTFLLMVGLSYGGSEAIKQIVRRARPDSAALAHPLAIEHSFSFPSGHTSFAAALGIALVFLARDHYVRRIVAIAVVSVAVVSVAASRMYIGVHYPTDVVAAIIYAVASSAFVLVIWLTVLLPRLRAARESRLKRRSSV